MLNITFIGFGKNVLSGTVPAADVPRVGDYLEWGGARHLVVLLNAELNADGTVNISVTIQYQQPKDCG